MIASDGFLWDLAYGHGLNGVFFFGGGGIWGKKIGRGEEGLGIRETFQGRGGVVVVFNTSN